MHEALGQCPLLKHGTNIQSIDPLSIKTLGRMAKLVQVFTLLSGEPHDFHQVTSLRLSVLGNKIMSPFLERM